jgi:hypothetical protein
LCIEFFERSEVHIHGGEDGTTCISLSYGNDTPSFAPNSLEDVRNVRIDSGTLSLETCKPARYWKAAKVCVVSDRTL